MAHSSSIITLRFTEWARQKWWEEVAHNSVQHFWNGQNVKLEKLLGMKLQHAFSPQIKSCVTFYISCISENWEMASFISHYVLELICSFLLASIYLSSKGICFIKATMWKTQTQRSICFLQEQCEQGINVILMPDKVLCYSREHNNEETDIGPEIVGLWIFFMVK